MNDNAVGILGKILDQIKATYNRNSNLHQKISGSAAIVHFFMQEAQKAQTGFLFHEGMMLIYNGSYWVHITDTLLRMFIKQALIRFYGDEVPGSERKINEDVFKQFPTSAMDFFPEQAKHKINFLNGTLNLDTMRLESHNPCDYFRYVLPYPYNSGAQCPKFMNYLKEVLPEEQERMVIAEYIGYLFTDLKLEKVLFLYGAGLNGKSVLVDIVESLLGRENISHESLSDMCGENGANSRSNLVGKLLNTCSDVSSKAFQGDIFKRLASGEPISFKILYQNVDTSTNYAKQLFCLNELPRTNDKSNGYYRRFLIAPFTIQIPKNKINPRLAKEIIATELPGIMNWVLEGRQRLLQQTAFTESPIMLRAVDDYKKQDTVKTKIVNLILPSGFKR